MNDEFLNILYFELLVVIFRVVFLYKLYKVLEERVWLIFKNLG